MHNQVRNKYFLYNIYLYNVCFVEWCVYILYIYVMCWRAFMYARVICVWCPEQKYVNNWRARYEIVENRGHRNKWNSCARACKLWMNTIYWVCAVFRFSEGEGVFLCVCILICVGELTIIQRNWGPSCCVVVYVIYWVSLSSSRPEVCLFSCALQWYWRKQLDWMITPSWSCTIISIDKYLHHSMNDKSAHVCVY